MQFSTTALFSVAIAATAMAVPTDFDFIMARDAEVAAAAANPIVNLYTDTKCTKLAKAVDLGTGEGCITYAAGFSSMKLASSPRASLGAFTYPAQACAGNATSYAQLTSTTACTQVGAGTAQKSFYHN